MANMELNLDNAPSTKICFTIGEVAQIIGENVSLVRFWADSFQEYIKPERNKKGNRLFSQKDLSYFKIIHHLVKDQGLTLSGAQKKLKENVQGLSHKVEIIEKLKFVRNSLIEIHDSLR